MGIGESIVSKDVSNVGHRPCAFDTGFLPSVQWLSPEAFAGPCHSYPAGRYHSVPASVRGRALSY